MTTLQLQRLGDFGCAGQGIGHGVHNERAAVAGITRHIHRRGIRGDTLRASRKVRALGSHHRQRTTSGSNGSSLVVNAMADALACAAEVAEALEL